MDSQVLRLIRRYDPVASKPTGSKTRPSLENTRAQWHTVIAAPTDPSMAPIPPPPASFGSPLLSRRAMTTNLEEELSSKVSLTPRLQRQQAIQEQDLSPSHSLRPILKYASPRPRAEIVLQPHRTEPLSVQIEAPPSNVPVESPATYQPLITTGTKRICSALSKSELDLRLQHDSPPPPVVPPHPFPVRPPSPPFDELVQPSDQPDVSPEPSIDRSKSAQLMNTNQNGEEEADEFDQMSAPIISNAGSSIAKLKQILARKSSLDIEETPRSNADLSPSVSSTTLIKSPPASGPTIEPPPRTVSKTNFPVRPHFFPEATPTLSPSASRTRASLVRSQTAIDRYVHCNDID